MQSFRLSWATSRVVLYFCLCGLLLLGGAMGTAAASDAAGGEITDGVATSELSSLATDGVVATGAPTETVSETSDLFQVTVREDGDAEILLRLTFDLADEAEQAAFEELREDETAAAETRDQFESRMESVATSSAVRTDRAMRVSNATVSFDSTDTTGVAILTVTWQNLASVEDDQLVVTEPFASGFTPEQQFVLRPPAGYEVDSVTPEPTDRDGTTLRWAAGADLSGFAAVFTADQTGDVAPGFGLGISIAALLSGALFARHHRRL